MSEALPQENKPDLLPKEKIVELKAAHGEIFLVEPIEEEHRALSVVVKRENLGTHFEAFIEIARDEEQNRIGAMKNFLRDVIVFPDRAELNHRFERDPGLVIAYFKGISAEAKTQLRVRTKKL